MLNIYHLHIIILGWMFLWLRTASILFLIIIRLLQQYKWIQWNDDKCPGGQKLAYFGWRVQRNEYRTGCQRHQLCHRSENRGWVFFFSSLMMLVFFSSLMKLANLQFASFPLLPDNEQSVFTSLILSFWSILLFPSKGNDSLTSRDFGWQSINKATKTHRQ